MALVKLSGPIEIPAGYITHSAQCHSAAIADHSTRAQVGTAINIPGIAGRMYTMIGVQVTIKSTATTVVNTGGLVEIENDAIDWKPFEFYPNMSSYVGANAGSPQSPTVIPCNKPLPAGSNVQVFYTALNAATDKAYITVIWSTKPYSGAQTFSEAGIGTAITQITVAAAHVTVNIPANKGGNCIGFLAQVYGVIETIVVGGGLVAVHNTAANTAWEPTEFVTGGLTSIGTGGGELLVLKWAAAGDCPGNSQFTFDYTPTDNQSQQLAVAAVWEA